MSLSLLTDPAAVEAAIDEYDEIGGEAFRAKYGYGKARTLFVVRSDTLYDSKAIAGVAVGKQHPERGPLTPDEFSGGDQTVRKTLEGLGFTLWSSDAIKSFTSTDALAAIQTAWGPELSLTKYIAVWATGANRRLALQLGVETVRIWTELQPPAEVGEATHYGPSETRHSNLKANAPSLAMPNAAWVTTVRSAAGLERLLEWYAGLTADALDLMALEALKAAFKRQLPDFSTFEEPGDAYLGLERSYKDELKALFDAEVAPLASSSLSDEAALGLVAAYYGVLTRKLASASNRPQNLISWQAVDRLKPSDPEIGIRVGRALNDLLIGDGVMLDRLDRFISDAGEAFRLAGATGPLGIARLLGSNALMLADPTNFLAIRTDVFERALRSLRNAKLPTYSDEPGRVRAALSLSEALFEQLRVDGWAPRDLIDIQSFLWVSLMYEADAGEGASDFAANVTRFLDRFREVRETPFRTVPDLWEIMGRIQQRLAALASVASRPTLRVEWSLGKGIWSRVPWIAIMDAGETTSTQSGLYAIFLVSRDLSTIELCLLQGTTELVDEHKTSGAIPILRARAEAYRSSIPELVQQGYRLDHDLNLGSEGRRAVAYEAGCIAHRAISTDALPSDTALDEMLEPLLAAYSRILETREPEPEAAADLPPYTVEDALSGLFIEAADFRRILDTWLAKKNIVLQGAPGVGKSFMARRLAYALMGVKDPDRVEVVQFHQSYGYEDFVQGYRPTAEGGFDLKDGVFYRFCERARRRPMDRHVFIIDEINRGNLSKIFGELMLLIEHDKRAAEWAARLAYASPDTPPFHVPDNVWLIGMMNTADRSLSVVDYALRRRFAFMTLTPGFTSPGFAEHLSKRGGAPDLIAGVIQGMQELNAAIGEDRINLGPGFQIGHSFFTPGDGDTPDKAWFERVIESEIRPLLEEYWFDAPDRADEWRNRLLANL